MFLHNLKYTLKTLFKNKMLIFWTYFFPIILGTFFNMAFKDIEKSEKLDIINIAIINNDKFEENEILKETFKTLSDKNNKDRLFNIKYTSKNKSDKLLKDDEITGYIMIDEEIKVIVKQNGIDQTILKTVTDEINQTQEIIKNLTINEIKKDPTNLNGLYQSINNKITNVKNEANIKNISSANLSYTMIEFYTLIAMTCLYGGIIGMTAINQNLPNMSHKGKRISVSPTSKLTTVISSAIASYIVQIVGLAILFIYTIFVLKVDYGSNLPLIILLALTGTLAGLSLGIAVSTLFKTNENLKTGIIISFTMVCSFLCGMMGITMKYVIDKNVPIINIINPANMITDGFYSLYYYETLDRYIFNEVSLIIFSVIMLFISIYSLRRQKYDSI